MKASFKDCEAKFVSTTKTINEVNHQTKKLIEEIGIKVTVRLRLELRLMQF